MTSVYGETTWLVLQRIADHVRESCADFDEIQSPQVKYDHNVAQINARLHQCFERLREQQPDDASNIENEIVQYAGERKMLEMNGLRDAENACKDQVAAVLQLLSDRLVATLHPSFFNQSIEKYATGDLKQYLPDDLVHVISYGNDAKVHSNHSRLANSSQNGMLQDAEKNASRKRQYYDLDEDRTGPNKKSTDSNATTVPCQQHSDDEPESSIVPRPDRISESIASSYEEEAHGDQDASQGTVVLKMIDAEGCPRGELKQIGSWGAARVDRILQRPVKRPVQLRRGRPFTEEHLSAICENGVKIVSCMIQASGEVMEQQPCTYCEKKNQGPFDQCIMVDDELFRRCGNCEWVRGRCQGASAAAETQLTSATEGDPAPEVLAATAQPNKPTAVQPQPRSPIEEQCNSNHATDSALTDETLQTGTTIQLNLPAIAEAAGFALNDTHWIIRQIKTSSFTSAESSIQLWCWLEEEESLTHMLLSNMQWKSLQSPVDFDVKLKDVAEVRASVQSWRVRLVMKQHAASGRHKAPRGDVMVVFEAWETVQNFVQFCQDQNIPVSEQEPPVMVTEWRNMASEYVLTGEE